MKTILWDVGGVLLKTTDRTSREKLAKEVNQSIVDLEAIFFGEDDNLRVQRGEISMAQHFKNVAQKLNIPASQIPQLQQQFFAGDTIDQHLMNWIDANRVHYQMVILSNAMPDMRDKLINHYHISHFFHMIFISAEMGLVKPNPQIYQEVIQTLDQKPEEICFIDDNQTNILSAKKLGIHAIHFKNRSQALTQLTQTFSK